MEICKNISNIITEYLIKYSKSMSKFKLPPPIIDIYLEKSLYKDHPKEIVFQIHPRPVDTIEKRLQRIKRYIEGIKEDNKNFLKNNETQNRDIIKSQ